MHQEIYHHFLLESPSFGLFSQLPLRNKLFLHFIRVHVFQGKDGHDESKMDHFKNDYKQLHTCPVKWLQLLISV